MSNVKRSRYGAKAEWCEIGGRRIYFRSKLERDYCRKLELAKQAKKILEWEHEPQVFWFGELRRGVTNYTPDFRITELDGTQWYAETKGYMDSKSKTKLKRMANYHPDVKLVLIR